MSRASPLRATPPLAAVCERRGGRLPGAHPPTRRTSSPDAAASGASSLRSSVRSARASTGLLRGDGARSHRRMNRAPSVLASFMTECGIRSKDVPQLCLLLRFAQLPQRLTYRCMRHGDIDFALQNGNVLFGECAVGVRTEEAFDAFRNLRKIGGFEIDARHFVDVDDERR